MQNPPNETIHQTGCQSLELYAPRPVFTQDRPLLSLPGRVLLAPLAGVSDLPYRQLCVAQGASSVCTELVSARGIRYSGLEACWRYIEITETERPVGIQLFGYEPEDFAYALTAILQHPRLPRPDFIDLNMGCPVAKVTKTGAGSALMKDPERAGKIVETCVEICLPEGIPVTAKIRKGYGQADRTAATLAQILVQAGVSLVAVHGRTREQLYSGQADWTCITEVVQAVSQTVKALGRYPVPVIGNGDITSGQAALNCLAQTGCDGVMIGRAAMGNPWIFAEIQAALAGREAPAQPTVAQRAAAIRHQLAEALQRQPEAVAVRELRKALSWYLKGTSGAASLRREAVSVKTAQEVNAFLDRWCAAQPEANPTGI